MTVFLPLDGSSFCPQSPSFLIPAVDPAAQLSRAIQAVMKAKRIVVICGAGISVQAGIPDFRSSDGLFQTLKRDNPREALTSGKDLFDASVFNSENTTTLFCQMIARLSDLSKAAEPTAFHHLLRALDDRGKLLRVYTQNIDAIEEKCGLTFGVPEYEGKRCRSRPKGKSPASSEDSSVLADDHQSVDRPIRHPSPPIDTPRCIPLHGTLQSVHCQICNMTFPLHQHLPAFISGLPPPCPECMSMEETRQLVGKRPRGIGRLRPSVVLYNEAHKDGEGVGEVVQKDLIGSSKGKGRSGADLLLVVGTSLRVPGTKRMVREFAKAVRSRGTGSSSKEEFPTPGPSTPRRSPATDDEPVMKALYLNLDFPLPTREWEGVFDAWIQGDAQQLAAMLREEVEKETKAREVILEKKRKRDEEATISVSVNQPPNTVLGQGVVKTPAKRKVVDSDRPAKKQKTLLPLSPPKSPGPPSQSAPPLLRDKTKLVLRIPPLMRRSCPEVYITSRPPVTPRPVNKMQVPPTPESTPPFNMRTKAGRRAARATRANKVKSNPRTPQKPTKNKATTPYPLLDSQADVLPEVFIRTVQYGLRVAG